MLSGIRAITHCNTMRAIILSAGRGSRMGKITDSVPKSLLPIGELTILTRLILQLLERGVTKITVVVGYKKDIVKNTIEEFKHDFFKGRLKSDIKDEIQIIENPMYKEDINILSLATGLGPKNKDPFFVFESDCIYDDKCIDKIIETGFHEDSYWYSMGPFESKQLGGILLTDSMGNVTDLDIVPIYDPSLSNYRKLIGILKVGQGQASKFSNMIYDEVKSSNIKQYYLQPWIDNLGELPCMEVKLDTFNCFAFNTMKEYEIALTKFPA